MYDLKEITIPMIYYSILLWLIIIYGIVDNVIRIEEIKKKLVHKLTIIIRMKDLNLGTKLHDYLITKLRNNTYKITFRYHQINPGNSSIVINKSR